MTYNAMLYRTAVYPDHIISFKVIDLIAHMGNTITVSKSWLAQSFLYPVWHALQGAVSISYMVYWCQYILRGVLMSVYLACYADVTGVDISYMIHLCQYIFHGLLMSVYLTWYILLSVYLAWYIDVSISYMVYCCQYILHGMLMLAYLIWYIVRISCKVY